MAEKGITQRAKVTGARDRCPFLCKAKKSEPTIDWYKVRSDMGRIYLFRAFVSLRERRSLPVDWPRRVSFRLGF